MHRIKQLLRLYKDFIAPTAVFTISIVLIIFGVIPVGRRVWEMKAELDTKTQEVIALREKKDILDRLDEDSLREQLQTALSAIPPERSIPTAILTLDELAAKTGVSLDTLSFTNPGSLSTESAVLSGQEEQRIGAPVLAFTITAFGSHDQVKNFFAEVIKVRRLLNILTFSIDIGDTGVDSLRADMGAYYWSLPTSLGKITDPIVLLTGEENDLLAKLDEYPWFSKTVALGPVGQIELGVKTNPFAQ